MLIYAASYSPQRVLTDVCGQILHNFVHLWDQILSNKFLMSLWKQVCMQCCRLFHLKRFNWILFFFIFFPHFIYFWLSFGCETQNENFWSISKTMKGNEDWSCKTLKWQKAPKKWFMTCALYSWSMIGYKSSVWGTEQYLSRYSLKILKSALALLWCIHKSSW